jgi:MFS family permease
MFRDPELSASLATSALVSTVMMSTLVVGPFYLSRVFGLDAAMVGLALSAGPAAAALTGLPAGRLTDRFGARRVSQMGLVGIATGTALLAAIPMSLGRAGYIAPLVVATVSYALFQTANNTSVMAKVPADQRGVVSGMLNLSRNLGLITGAAVMGALFAFSANVPDISAALPAAVAQGMRTTFTVATLLVLLALVIAVVTNTLSIRLSPSATRP